MNDLLTWSFDALGAWEAASAACDDGSHFSYRIEVCEDGTFDLSRSDGELGFKGASCHTTLVLAKEAAEAREREIRSSK